MSTTCSHDRIKYNCKDCCGGAYCQHSILKIYCKLCDGRAICQHDKRKYVCKECNPVAYCIHDTLKRGCVHCNSSVLCEHKKQKARCKLCGGSQICSHGRDKQRCIECGNGSQLCVHKKLKQQCIDCHGSNTCEHGKRKNVCKDCNGTSLCEHSVNKYQCSICRGSSFCNHNKHKRDCKECGGARLCKSEWCDVRGSKKFNGYCMRCCMYLFPDIPISRNYKTKEINVTNYIKEQFPSVSWITDKIITDGCSKRRPDLLLDMGSHVIAIEVDENKHATYDKICENKRIMEISKDINHRPLTLIRFNPDNYVDNSGNSVTSCWRNGKDGIVHIIKTKQKEWGERLEELRKIVEIYIYLEDSKLINIVELYYNAS